MIRRVDTKCVTFVLLFTFCQVMGTICAVPDLSGAQETALVVEEGLACPMDGTIMCPPSLTSSPERQIKQSVVVDVDQMVILVGPAVCSASVFVPPAQWPWSRAFSIVPIAIASSSVLRI